ncbi:MAG: tetratricopeptide repeat protein, partial [Acidobacteria bacterium]|nr:tetratricopeptide repeat protein [Acidobacteriota bacterium]
YDDYYKTSSGFRGFGFAERPAEEVIKPAISWLKKTKGKPWFCFIHLYDPHAPYIPPEPYRSKYQNDLYAGEVAYTDYALGKLVSFLEKEGLLKNTVIILTADHGESLGDHGEKTHGTFAYNSTLHIPLIFWQPRVFPKGLKIMKRVQHIDIAPTILELLGLHKRKEMQGRSLIPLINHPEKGEDEVCYFEAMSAYFNRNWAPLSGIIAGHYKYIELPIPEVYDMRNDFGEKKNLAKRNPRLLKHLKKKLATYISSHTSAEALTSTPLPVDEETRARLKALGYIVGSTGSPRKKRFTEADDPKNLIPLSNELDEGTNLFLAGKVERAIEVLTALIKKAPTFTPAYLNLAYVYHEAGDIDQAIAVLKEGVNKVLPTSTLLANLGLYLQERGDLEESLSILKKAIAKNKEDLDALNYLGVTYFYLGKRKEAIATFEKLLKIDKTFGSAHTNLGTVYLAEGMLNAAISEFKKAIKYNSSPTAYNGLGVASYRLGRVAEAIENFKRAVELDPRQFDTLYNLGIILLKEGRKEEAIFYLKRFLATAPSYKYAKDLKEVKDILRRLEGPPI